MLGKIIVVFVLFFSLVPSGVSAQSQDEVLEGLITNVQDFQDSQIVSIEITSGSQKGYVVKVENNLSLMSSGVRYKLNDRVVVTRTQDLGGQDIYYITDFVRRSGIYQLFIVFASLAVFVGGVWGAASLVGMFFSFLVLFKFVLPQILSGHDAIAVAVLGSAFIIPVTFSLSHGIKVKTAIAGIGTILTLAAIGILASYFVELTHLTGFAAEEANYLQFDLQGALNMKGLLLAGIIIASLGVLDDITISQSSIVQELKRANAKLNAHDLFKRGMNVGRDHIASLINTLVLVYAGASLPLLLLFTSTPRPFSEVINYEIIADEIVRTLVGSIGLILAVPITTAIAAYYYGKYK